MPGAAHKERLDLVSRFVKDERLIGDGDVRLAIQQLQNLVIQYPELVDGWFALGELQFHFGSLVGIPLSGVKGVVPGSPRELSFAIRDRPSLHARPRRSYAAARGYSLCYLAIDRSSVPASRYSGLADTLLHYRRYALRVIGLSPQRPPEVLEQIAFIAGEFSRTDAERMIGNQALEALWQRATRGEDKARAFRMLMARTWNRPAHLPPGG